MGFILEPAEATDLKDRNPKNRDVIFPYLNGEDLNTHPEQKPSRYVINFFDWPRERTLPGSWYALDARQQKEAVSAGVVTADYPEPVAADYPDCYEIVKARVYPVRKDVNREAHRKYWWHYGDKRPALYAAISSLKRVLVVAQTSKTLAFSFVPNGIVYSHAVIVFATEKEQDFAVMQSAFHIGWVLRYASSLRGDARYIPSDCFSNFPFPDGAPDQFRRLGSKGSSYEQFRQHLTVECGWGLTTLYNSFHNPLALIDDVVQLRQLHTDMDHAVAATYGWTDIDLGHGFHDTPQGVRYTISEPARREVLRRLLELNHARHAEELKAGQADGIAGSKRKVKGQTADTDQLAFL